MTILSETAQLVKETLGKDLYGLAVERAVVGIFFTGVKLTNGAAGVCFTPVGELPEAVCCPSSAGRSFDPLNRSWQPPERRLKSLSSGPLQACFPNRCLSGA